MRYWSTCLSNAINPTMVGKQNGRDQRVVIVADDLGASIDRNNGILHAMRKGVVTMTSLMVNAPAAKQAISLFRDAGLLDACHIGLHLNLTEGRPSSLPEQIPTLIAAQYPSSDPSTREFLGKAKFYRKKTLESLNPKDISVETKAQIHEFKKLCGFYPKTVDGHQHCHVTLATCEAVAQALVECEIRSTRIPTEPGAYKSLCPVCAMVSKNANIARLVYSSKGIVSSDAFVGLSFCGKSYTVDELVGAILSQLGRSETINSIEVMTHPSQAGTSIELDEFGRSKDRTRELEVLTSPDIQEIISRKCGRLVSRTEL